MWWKFIQVEVIQATQKSHTLLQYNFCLSSWSLVFGLCQGAIIYKDMDQRGYNAKYYKLYCPYYTAQLHFLSLTWHHLVFLVIALNLSAINVVIVTISFFSFDCITQWSNLRKILPNSFSHPIVMDYHGRQGGRSNLPVHNSTLLNWT